MVGAQTRKWWTKILIQRQESHGGGTAGRAVAAHIGEGTVHAGKVDTKRKLPSRIGWGGIMLDAYDMSGEQLV